ncbi:hypothetical protein POL67_03935 [Polyangium sp. rjm3]|uniref:Uncharacterized protein n=1 Tax=Polyangium mundeleinium TaxID=2995306 RepID=A0ABT5EFC7_9BACT|nr:hypothetical protein [Polyangium mundeleinium]MDC0740481.1 hypothetical protein [Polyangium mundeleinium]
MHRLLAERLPPRLELRELLLRVVFLDHVHHLDRLQKFIGRYALALRKPGGEHLQAAEELPGELHLFLQTRDVHVDDGERREVGPREQVPDLVERQAELPQR